MPVIASAVRAEAAVSTGAISAVAKKPAPQSFTVSDAKTPEQWARAVGKRYGADAVSVGGVYGRIRDIEELDAKYPGITDILERWWVNFKGQDVTVSYGYVGAKSAMRHVDAGADTYEHHPPARTPHQQ